MVLKNIKSEGLLTKYNCKSVLSSVMKENDNGLS